MDFKAHLLIFIILIYESVFTSAMNQLEEKIENKQFIPVVPKECLERGYCEKVLNYPEELAASLIAKLEKRGFKPKLLGLTKMTRKDSVEEKEYNCTPSPMPLCDSISEYITPKAARDALGNWHFILNIDKKPIQQFQVVLCHPYPQNCEKFFSFPGTDYVAMCQQKKSWVELIAMDRYGHPVIGAFQVDCCCTCDAARRSTIL